MDETFSQMIMDLYNYCAKIGAKKVNITYDDENGIRFECDMGKPRVPGDLVMQDS